MHKLNRRTALMLGLGAAAILPASALSSRASASSGPTVGKIRLAFVISAPAELVEEGDRLFQSHAIWMEATHHREGPKALLSYDVSKAPELSNPMDPTSAPTGNTVYVLAEVYESEAGVADHFEQAGSNWDDFPAFLEWLEGCRVTAVPAAEIFNSLW